MVIGDLKDSSIYGKLDTRIATCLKYALSLNKDVADGRYDVCEGVYVNVSSYEPKLLADACYETHVKYADLQLVLDGAEYIGYADISDVMPLTEYDEDKDIRMWSGDIYPIKINARHWALFLPNEPHAPAITAGVGKVKKAVFKILW